MAGASVTKVYAVEDCKVYSLNSDSVSGGASYDTGVDVPGIKELTITGTVNTKELRGDNQLLDSNSTLQNISATVSHAKLSFPALEVITGGTAGSGSFNFNGTDQLGYFKIEAKTPTSGGDDVGGDVHFILPKCIISSWPEMGLAEEDYRIASFQVSVLPRLSDGSWIEILTNTSAQSLETS